MGARRAVGSPPCDTLSVPFGPSRRRKENRMAFMFRLEREAATPADPPTLVTAVPTWRIGDTIPLGPGRTLRVIEIRPGRDGDAEPILVVEPA
jgi:hypothetical protein